MNVIKPLFGLLLISLLVPLVSAEQAQDVDQADSLDFEAFHKKKDGAIMLYDGDTGKVLGIGTGKKTAATVVEETPSASNEVNAVLGNQGQKYEIRELYAIGKSQRTGYTPSTVMQAIHLQVQGFCSQGWRKLDERSEPDGEEFYMYYVFECL